MRRRIQSRGLGRRCGRKRLSLGRHGRDGMCCRRGGRMQRRIGSCGLGRRYGLGVPQSYAEALKWYQKAACRPTRRARAVRGRV
jgi:hypothetical protein